VTEHRIGDERTFWHERMRQMKPTLADALAEWRTKALAATPGPWRYRAHESDGDTPPKAFVHDGKECTILKGTNGSPIDRKVDPEDEANCLLAASCSPERVLALIAVVEAVLDYRARQGVSGGPEGKAIAALERILGAEEASR